MRFAAIRIAILTFLAVFAVSAGGFQGANAQKLPEPQIGIIDVQGVLNESKAAQSLRPQVDKLRREFQEQVKKEEQVLRQAEQELSRQRAILSPEAFTEKRRDFGERASAAQKQVQNRRRDLDRAVNAAQNVILRSLVQIAQDVAKEKGLNIVMDKRFVFISVRGLDISREVLTRLDKRLTAVKIDLGKEKSSDAPGKKK